jgi:hypothetical protein
MFASIILTLPFLTVALLPVMMKSLFSSDELRDMGIGFEDYPTTPSVDSMGQQGCIVCNTTILCGQA